MSAVSLELLTSMILLTTLLVEGLKKSIPKLVEDREEVFALFLPVLFCIAAKLFGQFADTGWFPLLIAAVGSGVGSGLSHDYVMKGLPGISRLFTRAAPVLLIGVLMMGCCTVSEDYFKADRATYEAIAPDYSGYVTDDASLTPEQKATRLLTVKSWDLRIRKAEGK